MLTLTDYIRAVFALLPVFSALACGGMLAGLSLRDCRTPEERKRKVIVVTYMLVAALAWFCTFCYGYFPRLFVYLNVPCLLSYLFVPILFYRIVCFLTYPDREEHFSIRHYLAPFMIGTVLLIWSFFIPFEIQLQITRGFGQVFPPGYEAYARLFTAKPPLRMLLGLIYYSLIVIWVVRYYKAVRTPGSSVHKPGRWIVFLLVVSLILVFTSLFTVTVPRSQIFTSVWSYIGMICVILQHVLITYSMIGRKYLPYVVYDRVPKPADEENGTRRQHAGKTLTPKRMEHYFRTEKPYLKPDLKITDLVEALDVNRSILSAFINRTYGMNFNRYVNQWRLKELELLLKLPANEGKKPQQLCGKAGFANSKHYLRAFKTAKEQHLQDDSIQLND